MLVTVLALIVFLIGLLRWGRPIAAIANHSPAPTGPLWAAAKAGDARRIASALARGYSTEEADDVSHSTRVVYELRGTAALPPCFPERSHCADASSPRRLDMAC